mgnify:CR=1 FL=1
MSNNLGPRESGKEIARAVGGSSNQALIRLFVNHRHRSASDFREAQE